MTFKREISIDGVVAILAIIGMIVKFTTMQNTQDAQGKAIEQHTQDIRQINQTEAKMADSVSVLTAIVNERTAAGRVDYPATTRR